MRRCDDEFEVDWKLVRAVSHGVSLLALWRHWDEPEIHWFSGGHVLGIWNESIREFVAAALEQSEMVRR